MTIATILARKGNAVATISPDASIMEAAKRLAERRIGALVVSGDGLKVEGILSERDVVRGVGLRGAAILDEPVRALMTARVVTCAPESTVIEVMAKMTEGMFRHMPVVVEAKLAGIVSIGDIVRKRVDELSLEAESLKSYVSGN